MLAPLYYNHIPDPCVRAVLQGGVMPWEHIGFVGSAVRHYWLSRPSLKHALLASR